MICTTPRWDTLRVHGSRGRRPVVDLTLAWSSNLSVKVGGAGTVAHAGVVLPRLLGDQLGLTTGLAEVLARSGFMPIRHRGRTLVAGVRWPRGAFYAGPTCLVIDELGYLPLPAEGASALFQVIAQRYTKSSTILTTNRPITSWGEVLGDTTVAAALLDRLLHRSVVLDIGGDSYRLRDHHARTHTLRAAAGHV